MLIFIYWIPTLLYMALIFYMSSIPGKDIQPPVSDVIIHLAEYFILMLLILFSISRSLFRRVPARICFWAFLLASLFALSDEFHQAFTPGRHPSLKDLAVDGTAALLALGCRRILSRDPCS